MTGVPIGSYPFFREGRVGANFVIRSTEQARLGDLRAPISSPISRRRAIQPVVGGI